MCILTTENGPCTTHCTLQQHCSIKRIYQGSPFWRLSVPVSNRTRISVYLSARSAIKNASSIPNFQLISFIILWISLRMSQSSPIDCFYRFLRHKYISYYQHELPLYEFIILYIMQKLTYIWFLEAIFSSALRSKPLRSLHPYHPK